MKPRSPNLADGTSRPAHPLPLVEPGLPRAGTVRASRSGPIRATVLILVHLLIIGHVLHWSFTGRTISPVEPSETMFTLERGEVNAGFVFFSLALGVTLLLGRFVCGWACHMVALQDLCAWMMKKLGVRPRPFRSRLLVYVPLIAALYMFVYPSVQRVLWPSPGNAFPGFSNHLTTTDFWRTFPGVGVAIPFLLVCGFAAVYFLGSKGFCTYACPYGGFFGLAEKFAPARIRVSDACDACGHCTAVCTSNVRVHAEVRDYGAVVDPGCMKCLDCVSVCPQDALRFGFGRPSLATRPRVPSPEATRSDLPWGEEIAGAAVFAMTMLAIRGIYGVVPFLMALGVSAIIAFGVLKMIHLCRRQAVSLQNLTLKSAGRLRPAGWVFAAAGFGTLAIVVHCGWIRYHLHRGTTYHALTDVSEESVLSGAGRSSQVPDEVVRAAAHGVRHLRTVDRWGLIRTAEVQQRLAWFSLLLNQREATVDYLRRAQALAGDDWRSAYYLGSVLSSMNRFRDAIASYQRALAGHPEHAPARFKLGNAYAETGDLTRAKECWRDVLQRQPDFTAARHNLAGALRAERRFDEAVTEYGRALAQTPDDAATHFELGVTFHLMGRPELAGVHFARAVELDPKYAEMLE